MSEIDPMEYATDALARAGYITNAAVPTGGNITVNGTKRVHVFLADGTFGIPAGFSGNVEILVVGGGGAGRGVGAAGNSGDGGSAGELVYNASYAVTEGNYNVVIGSGGVGVANDVGGNGGASSFGDVTANGGQGGQNTSSSTVRCGGNGAGADGGSGSGSTAGAGGIGLAYAISGASVYYAGGGGGGYTIGGLGGNGGGGRGESYNASNGAAGVANSGAGGGGVSHSTALAGKNGGSGIVIVSYEMAEFSALTCYSEPSIKVLGSYSLKVVALVTDSINKKLTKQVSPAINLAGVDYLRLFARASRIGSNFKLGIHDSGGTTTEHTVNILEADIWQPIIWDISNLATASKDAIDQIIITITNSDAENTIYLDCMTSELLTNYMKRGRRPSRFDFSPISI